MDNNPQIDFMDKELGKHIDECDAYNWFSVKSVADNWGKDQGGTYYLKEMFGAYFVFANRVNGQLLKCEI